MNPTTNTLVQKLWNYCNVLRDDGMSYGDYVEQLTYLLFLKMADERSAPPYNQASIVPAVYAWPTLLAKDGDELFDHYRHALERLGQEKGTLGLIFGKAQNKFQDPAKLRRVIVDLIDAETWTVSGNPIIPTRGNRIFPTHQRKGAMDGTGRRIDERFRCTGPEGPVQRSGYRVRIKPGHGGHGDWSTTVAGNS